METKILYRVKYKDSTGADRNLLIQSDDDQFIVGEEMKVQTGKTAGEIRMDNQRFYPTLVQALYFAAQRISKQEAKDLATYAKSIQKWGNDFLNALGGLGLKDPLMKEYFR